MSYSDFKIGERFMCGGTLYQVTDVGTRTMLAIEVREGWMAGPPYALAEFIFDEDDRLCCLKEDSTKPNLV